MDAFFAEAEEVDHVSEHAAIRISDDGTIGTTTLPSKPFWDGSRRG